MATKRGTTNRNARGSTEDRRRRREWLVATYRSDVDMATWVIHAPGEPADGDNRTFPVPARAELKDSRMVTWTREPTCRCYRCGVPLTVDTVTVDRIVPGCQGGTYRRTNIRPACGGCNSETGGALRATTVGGDAR